MHFQIYNKKPRGQISLTSGPVHSCLWYCASNFGGYSSIRASVSLLDCKRLKNGNWLSLILYPHQGSNAQQILCLGLFDWIQFCLWKTTLCTAGGKANTVGGVLQATLESRSTLEPALKTSGSWDEHCPRSPAQSWRHLVSPGQLESGFPGFSYTDVALKPGLPELSTL